MHKEKITIIDSTLRDGNHAVKQQIDAQTIKDYARIAEKAGIPILVVGHGNGLGASSLQLGEAKLSDGEMLAIARRELDKTKLAALLIPGFGTIADIDIAISEGTKVMFIACHCTEATVSKQHIEYCVFKDLETYGVLMMSHRLDPQ